MSEDYGPPMSRQRLRFIWRTVRWPVLVLLAIVAASFGFDWWMEADPWSSWMIAIFTAGVLFVLLMW